MTEEMGHDRCSELLRAYARDELAAPEKEAVESHLSACGECRAELGAVRVLLAGESDSLTGRERRKLHAAVERSLVTGPSAETTGLPPRRTWAQRFAPTLAAAALLLVAVGVAVIGDGGSGEDGGGTQSRFAKTRGGDEDPAAETSGGAGGAEAGTAPVEGQFEGTKPKPQRDDTESTDTLAGGAGGGRPHPAFKSTFVTDLGQMTNGVLGGYAATYTVADAEKRADGFLVRLSAGAPSDLRDQVRTCGRAAFDAAKDPVLPAAGAVGRIEEEASLLLSFAYSEREHGPLESYMVWAWPRGSCSARLDYESGPIKD